jgi:hypothetical protein
MSSLHFDLYLHSNMSYVYIYIQDFKLEYFQHICGTYYGKNFITFSKIQKMIWLYRNLFPKKICFFKFCPKIPIFLPNLSLNLNCPIQNSPQKKMMHAVHYTFSYVFLTFSPHFQSNSILFLVFTSQHF